MQYEVINLCPHDVNIVDGPTYPKSGDVARVAERPGQPLDGLPFPATTASSYGEVTGLPAPEPGKLYIVSGMVAAACPGRADVFAPGESVRDTEGRIIGVKNLKQAPPEPLDEDEEIERALVAAFTDRYKDGYPVEGD
jgi:hypothetical protein